MDGQSRLDDLFVVPGKAGYVPAFHLTMHPCCSDDDESDEEESS
jgi:hypothetical protein